MNKNETFADMYYVQKTASDAPMLFKFRRDEKETYLYGNFK